MNPDFYNWENEGMGEGGWTHEWYEYEYTDNPLEGDSHPPAYLDQTAIDEYKIYTEKAIEDFKSSTEALKECGELNNLYYRPSIKDEERNTK